MEGPPTCECLGMSKETSCQALAKFIKTQTKQPESGFGSVLKDLIQDLESVENENKEKKNVSKANDNVLSGADARLGLLNEEQQMEEDISDVIVILADEPVAKYLALN